MKSHWNKSVAVWPACLQQWKCCNENVLCCEIESVRAFLSQTLYNTKRELLLSCDTFHSSICGNFWMLELCEIWGQFRIGPVKAFLCSQIFLYQRSLLQAGWLGIFLRLFFCVCDTLICVCLNATICELFTSHDDTKQNFLLYDLIFTYWLF